MILKIFLKCNSNFLKLSLRLHIMFEWMSGMSFYGFKCFVYFRVKFCVQIKHTHQQFNLKVHLETVSDGEFKKFIWFRMKTSQKKWFMLKKLSHVKPWLSWQV